MITRRLAVAPLGLILIWALAVSAAAADLKPIHTQTTKDVVITLANEAGQLTKGKNRLVLEFTSPATKQPVNVGTVRFETSMAMPGMSPMLAGATVTPDKTPGRYLATIEFPDSGTRQVTIAWDGPAGKGTSRFSVPVR
jgi:YtkA-like